MRNSIALQFMTTVAESQGVLSKAFDAPAGSLNIRQAFQVGSSLTRALRALDRVSKDMSRLDQELLDEGQIPVVDGSGFMGRAKR